jgi:hypothetical protein
MAAIPTRRCKAFWKSISGTFSLKCPRDSRAAFVETKCGHIMIVTQFACLNPGVHFTIPIAAFSAMRIGLYREAILQRAAFCRRRRSLTFICSFKSAAQLLVG